MSKKYELRRRSFLPRHKPTQAGAGEEYNLEYSLTQCGVIVTWIPDESIAP